MSAGVPATASEGTSITFAGSISGGTGPYTEFWNFGDGTTASGSLAPSHIYEESGNYTALLCVTDGANLFATSTGTVTVAKVAPTVTLTGPSTGEVGSAMTFFAAVPDPATADLFAGFTYKWNFGDGTTSSGTNQAPTHTFAVAGTYHVSVTATGKDGATSILATKAIVITTATIIPIDQAWLQSHGPSPYILNQAGATYQLQTNLTTSGTAFRITQNNITLDLGGHTVTYDNANPITVTNAGFETGNTSGWNMSQAPGATVAPAMLGMYGNWMLDFPKITAKQTFVSSPISIPQANIPYIAGIQAKSSAWGAATATLTAIDAATNAILGTPQTLDPGGGPILTVTFTPTTTHPVVLKIEVQPNSGQTATVSFDYASLYRNNVLGVDLSYKQNVTIIDGTVTQGQGHSAQSPAICAYGALFALEGVTA